MAFVPSSQTFDKIKSTAKSSGLVQINTKAIKGEPGTGLEDDKKGEFTCRNCQYFRPKDHSCGQADMMKNSKKPRTKDGRVVVAPLWCCEYVDRTGKFHINTEEA